MIQQQIGIGTDIEEIQRFRNCNSAAFVAFLAKIFSKSECDYCQSKDDPAPHFAGRFAGKEAVIKALSSLNIKNIWYPDIEILNNNYGVPYVKINTEKTEKLLIKISLSHSPDLVLAFCIIIQEQ
ncbi:MAG: holo-ACP synthase [Methanomicrobiales archaeon]